MKLYTLTNEEYYRTEVEIYNDLPITLDCSENHVFKEFNKSVADKHMVEGEKYAQINEMPHKVLTNYGRMINTHTDKVIKPAITGTTLYWNIGNWSFRTDKELPKLGMKYDHELSCRKFNEYNWPHLWSGSKQYNTLKDYVERNGI